MIRMTRWSVSIQSSLTPLYGTLLFYPMFDPTATHRRLDSWLNQRLFCVDQRVYNLRQTLSFLANTEGAHVDTRRDDEAIDMERVHFGRTTYYHLVALLTAMYILEQYSFSRETNQSDWDSFSLTQNQQPTERAGLMVGEFKGAEIDPTGFPNVFHETGIPIPQPGEVWRPVSIEDAVSVCA